MEHGFASSSETSQRIPDIISAGFLQTLRDHGVVEAHLFGSFAHGTAGPDSDIDLLVTFDPPVTLFQQMDLAEELSRLCGRRVDLMTKHRSRLCPVHPAHPDRAAPVNKSPEPYVALIRRALTQIEQYRPADEAMFLVMSGCPTPKSRAG